VNLSSQKCNFLSTIKHLTTTLFILLLHRKSVIFAATIAAASAFAPAQVAKTTTSLNAFEDELGAQVNTNLHFTV
jgi:hypothetical protein